MGNTKMRFRGFVERFMMTKRDAAQIIKLQKIHF